VLTSHVIRCQIERKIGRGRTLQEAAAAAAGGGGRRRRAAAGGAWGYGGSAPFVGIFGLGIPPQFPFFFTP